MTLLRRGRELSSGPLSIRRFPASPVHPVCYQAPKVEHPAQR
ncbi:hypothetical protein ATN83_3402 [Raoultella ornithinolytica]|nr:hypothetical protein ATN83_3402 [Raoultella ornithinolytica]KDX13767.1 hypothetical protein AB28_2911 [Raoultella ornithinolytica 2-156-04_S1_C2]